MRASEETGVADSGQSQAIADRAAGGTVVEPDVWISRQDGTLLLREFKTGRRGSFRGDDIIYGLFEAGARLRYGLDGFDDPGSAPRAEHPVVRVHDETGRRALYVCRAFTRRFADWSREESASLLDYLYQHSVRPEFQARHTWKVGDLAMWDNRSVLHFAVHDHADQSRVIHRLQVEGPVPV